MTKMGAGSVASETLRKKLSVARPATTAPAPSGGEKAWRLALARAFRDTARLDVDILSCLPSRRSLAEVLDQDMDHALILLLQGPEDGLGLLVFSPDVLAGTVEMLTLGRCGERPPERRRPSRTDAAMLAPLADRALSGLQSALEDDEDLVWAEGFHFVSFIEESRPLGLVLDDTAYRVFHLDLSLSGGRRKGWVSLVLPADGAGRRPTQKVEAAKTDDLAEAFAAQLAERVQLAPCQLDVVVGRVSMPLAEAMSLTVGAILPIGGGGLSAISLDGLDGRRLAEGKLGQHRGMRAVKLTGGLSLGDARAPTLGSHALTANQPPGTTARRDALQLVEATEPQADLIYRATGTG